jgi:hypothetical protein
LIPSRSREGKRSKVFQFRPRLFRREELSCTVFGIVFYIVDFVNIPVLLYPLPGFNLPLDAVLFHGLSLLLVVNPFSEPAGGKPRKGTNFGLQTDQRFRE